MDRWRIRVDQDGNVDQKDILNQVEKKGQQKVSQFKTGCIISIVGAALAFFIIVGLGIYIWYKWKQSGGLEGNKPGEAPVVAAVWDGKTPFTCANKTMTLEGMNVTLTSGTAITTMAGCKLTLKNMKVTAPTVIEAMGNSEVIVEGGEIKGTDAAIKAGGTAVVTVKGATVTGKSSKLGASKIEGVPGVK